MQPIGEDDYDAMLAGERKAMADALAELPQLDASTPAGLKDARSYLAKQVEEVVEASVCMP